MLYWKKKCESPTTVNYREIILSHSLADILRYGIAFSIPVRTEAEIISL